MSTEEQIDQLQKRIIELETEIAELEQDIKYYRMISNSQSIHDDYI